MTVQRIDRFRADPDRAEELVARRNAVVAAVRRTGSGLLEARLLRLDDQNWLDLWHWDSAASAQAAAARAQAGQIPEAGPAFALTSDHTTQFAEVVDER